MKRFRTAGWPRRFASIVVIAFTCTFCIISVYMSRIGRNVFFIFGAPIETPILYGEFAISCLILGFSLLGNTLLAWLTFDANKMWRAVDYPWVFAAFIAIVVSLANIKDADQRGRVAGAQNDYLTALNNLRAALSNSPAPACDEKGLNANASAACQSIGYALGVVQNEIPVLQNHEYWGLAVDDWWKILFKYGNANYKPTESSASTPQLQDGNKWSYLNNHIVLANVTLSIYLDAEREFQDYEKTRLVPFPGPAARFWYFILAYFVGLRLSRTTAELLQARQAERQRKPKEDVVEALFV
jgi:hypothetical protein